MQAKSRRTPRMTHGDSVAYRAQTALFATCRVLAGGQANTHGQIYNARALRPHEPFQTIQIKTRTEKQPKKEIKNYEYI
jgi:hypothetical protein